MNHAPGHALPTQIYPQRWRRGWPWLLWALLWLGLGTGLYLLRDAERHTIVANETAQLLTQSQIAARVLEMEIEAADHALDMLLAGLPVWQQHPHNQQRATEHLQRVLDVLLGTRSFTVLDGNGVVQLSTVPTLVGGNYAHWPFFQEIAQTVHHNIARVFISRPYLTSNNTWAVNVSRAMLNDGQLRGVVVATLDPTFFRDLMNELRYTDDMVVGLVHDSGQPYVASAHPSTSTADMLQHLAEVYTEQWVSSISVPTHPEHLHVSSNIRPNGTGSIRHNFTAIAMRDTRQVLRSWHQQNRSIGLLFGVAMLASALALVAYQQWARRMQQAAEQAEAALLNMAFHDPLTQALNRRAFTHAVEQELQRMQRASGGAALLMLDVDHFKHINDHFGHDVGDQVLQTLVQTLQQQLREIDLLGRLGGEEFAVLLPLTDLDGAVQLAERLRAAVADLALPVPLPMTAATDGQPNADASTPPAPLRFTISLGVTVLQAANPHESIDTALKRTDQAMYQAKTTGRNRVCVVP